MSDSKRDLKKKVYPCYCTSDLAAMCEFSYERMRRFLKKTPLWERGVTIKNKKWYWLTDIQNYYPELWDSVILAGRINDAAKLEVDEEDLDDGEFGAHPNQFR